MPRPLTIGARRIGPDEPVFVVAEIGINHGGSVAACARLIEAAAAAGADAVKLQTVSAAESYVRGTASYGEFSDRAFGDDALVELTRLAGSLGVTIFSTPGDFTSLDQMSRVGMPAVKVSSGLLTNLPLIAEAARRRMPLILSTGMAHEREIAAALDTAWQHGAPGAALLKCTALYPAPDEAVNLAGIAALERRFDVPVGYSDHTLDDLACTAAVALGATVIEKHVTLDRTLPGADHRISMEPAPFAAMVGKLRRLERMRGDGGIRPAPAEEGLRPERHRCLVARRNIAAGERFTRENVALKRPLPGRVGLSPIFYDRVLGLVSAGALREDDPITEREVPGLS